MDIHTASYNNYSLVQGSLGGNSSSSSPAPTRYGENTSQPKTEGTSPIPLTPRDTAVTDPDQQTTQTSDPRSEQQQYGSDSQLTQAEFQLLAELKQADTEVRNHEMAHVAAGGSLITSGASFTYQRGPDGKNYAVAGEVSIDTSAVPGDPRATLQKMQQVKSSALAPASPSAQDLKVASNATSRAAKASSELTILMAEEQAAAKETQAFGSLKQASDSYTRVNDLPETDTSTFKLAV